MNSEEFRIYCLSKKGVTECFPFDEVTLVFKVMGKMFALLSTDDQPQRINLKCDPDKAITLRERFSAVVPGYHMNKRLWNSISLDGSIESTLLKEWTDESYNLIVAKMTKKMQAELHALD